MTTMSTVPSRAPSENVIKTTKSMFDVKRNSAFSAKLLKHGMIQFKTMNACDREKRKEMDIFEKSKSAISISCNEFDEVVEQVRQIQTNLAMRQKQMAMVATEKYSALCIQTAVRVMFAKTKVLKMRKGRLIVGWYIMKWGFKRRLRLRIFLQRVIKKFVRRLRASAILKMVRDVKKLQARMNEILEVERQIIKTEIKKFEAQLVRHWFVFGAAKATKVILRRHLAPSTAALEHNEPLNCMVRLYKRYKRLRFLRGTFGKLVYCAISQVCETEDDAMRRPPPYGFGEHCTPVNIYQYIKGRVDAHVQSSRSDTPTRRAHSPKRTMNAGSSSSSGSSSGSGGMGAAGHASTAHGRTGNAAANNLLLTTKQSSNSKLVVTADNSSNVPIMFPVECVGFFKITSLRGLVELIEDLQTVALASPQLVDNKIPLTLYNSAINAGVICNSIMSPARMSRKPSVGSGGYIPAMLGAPAPVPVQAQSSSSASLHSPSSSTASASGSQDPRKRSTTGVHPRPKCAEKCFPTYCPPVGPFFMNEEAIAAAMALAYPDGYTPYKEPPKKKRPTRGKPIEASSLQKAAEAAAAGSIGGVAKQPSPVPPTDKSKPSKSGGVATSRSVR